MRMIFLLLVLLASAVITPVSQSQKFDCKKFGKGQCTDYIEHVLNVRQRGNAGDWKVTWTVGRDDMKQIQKGDVAVFGKSRRLPYGHVAIIERVQYRPNTDIPVVVDISEWNWGRESSDPERRFCAVTEKHRTKTERSVRISELKGVWRPTR